MNQGWFHAAGRGIFSFLSVLLATLARSIRLSAAIIVHARSRGFGLFFCALFCVTGSFTATASAAGGARITGASGPRPQLPFSTVAQSLIGDCSNVDNPSSLKDMECKHLRMALREDGMTSCAPDPAVVFNGAAYGSSSVPIPQYMLGWQNHSIFPLDYRHTFYASPRGELVIGLRIHFGGYEAREPAEQETIDAKLFEAERIWERSAPMAGLRFRFVREEDPRKAHYAVNYVRGRSRGPYIWTWSAQWPPSVFAHEIGHFMGLHDEYAEFDQLRPERHCNPQSLMCSSWSGSVLPYHYYIILRRAHCSHTEPPSGGGWPI